MSALKFKDKDKRVRLIFTDGPGPAAKDMGDGKVFAVIGPFDTFTDKQDLQDALETFVRGWNLEENTP